MRLHEEERVQNSPIAAGELAVFIQSIRAYENPHAVSPIYRDHG